MNPLAGLVGSVVIVTAVVVGITVAVGRYGTERYSAGFAAAVAIGKERLDFEVELARITESDLRIQLRTKDDIAFKKETQHAESLAAVQRRMLTSTDSLRCPASAVPVRAPPAHGPAAGRPAPDGRGPEFMPEAAADVLGVAGHIAGLVRRYERLEQRFDECQALTTN